ncbi:MAG: patatin family protein [Lachnospiraceae bacterium]|nr:patatin family protein [Lachnospiraceae bacterium]
MKDGAMILEGGAVRGVFTAGALDFLQEQDFMIRHVIGVSAGSGNLLNFLSRQRGRMRDCTIRQREEDGKLIDFKRALHTGSLFDMDLLFDIDPKEKYPFDFDTFFASPMGHEIVVTNCLTGQAEYLAEYENPDRLMLLARASSSMPLVSPVVELQGIPYLDGGLADSIPLFHAMQLGCRKNVVILTRNKGYRKSISRKAMAIYGAALKKYPEVVKAICRRPLQYNRTLECIEKWESEGRIFVVRPQVPAISRMETKPDALMGFYSHGYEQMKKQYEAMLCFLDA